MITQDSRYFTSIDPMPNLERNGGQGRLSQIRQLERVEYAISGVQGKALRRAMAISFRGAATQPYAPKIT
jgi:hypothetical protein